jgi:hypothetical protein
MAHSTPVPEFDPLDESAIHPPPVPLGQAELFFVTSGVVQPGGVHVSRQLQLDPLYW